MQCAVLVGGRGTRLGTLVENCPKPMLAVNGRPFLEYIIENAARFGFDEFLLLAGYRAVVVVEHFAQSDFAKRLGVNIQVVAESHPMGTAGALAQAAAQLKETFLLLNGDSFFDFNLLDLGAFDVGDRWIGRLALREVPDASRFGVVALDPGGRIMEMRERPGRAGPGVINGGVYWLRREILAHIPSGESSLERDVFPSLSKRGLLLGRRYDGFFLDIGIPEDFRSAGKLMGKQLRRPAMFFDRDGVLNEDSGYTHSPRGFRWISGAREAVKLVNDAGWYAFVVTNQAGVARGLYDEAAVQALHRWMNADLRAIGAHIDAFGYCPHHPEGVVPAYSRTCSCRKPAPGMLLNLMDNWPVDRGRSMMIGDKESDLEAAAAAGVKAIRFSGSNLARIVGPAMQ